MKRLVVLQSVAVIMGLMAPETLATSPDTATTDSTSADEIVWEAEVVETGELWQGMDGEASAATGVHELSPEIAPMLAPGIIALCNAGFGDTVVQSMNSARDGTVRMRCGDSGAGYVHIRSNHQTGWTRAMVGPGNWDDFMMFATVNAVEAPSRTAVKPGSKRCYTTPINLYRWENGVRVFVKTMNPSVVISTNNKMVITSIPTTLSSC